MQIQKDDLKRLVEEVFLLYELYGKADYIGEPVSQIEHMSQTAAYALAEGQEDEIVLAAFFHDIGHICTSRVKDLEMSGYGIVEHENAGADFLKGCGFSKRITTLVGNHVPAKRYLTFKVPEYYHSLSEASKKTLEFQGGRMSADEASQFEASPYFEESIRLRKWDELAKEQNKPIIDFELLKTMALNHLKNQ